jgi:hypothetical protein
LRSLSSNDAYLLRPRRLAVIRALLCAIGVLLLVGAASGTSPEAARAFLAATFTLTREEIGRVDAGHVVARTISSRDSREVATLGVVRIQATPAFYVEQLSDIVKFKRDEAVLQIGTFSTPPLLADVAHLTLDPFDVGKLRECRINDCGVQLSADAIERFRQGVDWRRDDAVRQASLVMQQTLVEYVTRYRDAGASATMHYVDQEKTVDVNREFRSLLEADAATWQHFGPLRQHLLEYPAATPGTTDILYWSKERVSRRNVVSVTHLAMTQLPSGPADYAIASRQIYGTHYFDASLGLTVLLPEQTGGPRSMYVVYLNRSRVDLLDGMFGGIARRIVASRARALVAEQLGRLQRTIEHDFAATSPRAARSTPVPAPHPRAAFE